MSEFKGTKGKWVLSNKPYLLENNYQGSFDIRTEDFKTKVAEVNAYSFYNIKGIEEAKANALLISKAPEMLTMLENMLLIFETLESTINIMPIINLIKEATEL
jgi:hypothetical protein